MVRHAGVLAIAAVVALPFGAVAREASEPKTVRASVTVTTSDNRRAVAVQAKGAAGEPVFLFCIDLAAPVSQKIQFTGPARVIYRPLRHDLPEGVKISGPESVSSALAVLPAEGKGWLFLATNEKTVLRAGDPAGASATVVSTTTVNRMDWVADDGQRRGMDIEPCFNAGG